MQNEEITTIKLKKTTKERMEKLRTYPRETYDDILERMLGILNLTRVNPEKAQSKLINIDRQHKKENREKRLKI
ncbi:hypothetical protein J4402_04570 [Candidatus Pacearchaeota archaeon]|nr:hypothetical protein [Candidatus Pacearchaeota archaeon]